MTAKPILLLAIGTAVVIAAVAYRFTSNQAESQPRPFPIVKGLPLPPPENSLNENLESELLKRYQLAKQTPSNRKPARELAQLYHANGFLNQATEIYRDQLENDLLLEYPEFPYLAANAFLDTGDQPTAISILQRLAPKSNYAPLFLKLGDVHLKNSEISQARVAYHKCLELESQSVHALIGLARCSIQAKNWTEALGELSRAAEIDDSMATLHSLLAEVYQQRGEANLKAKAQKRAYLEKEYFEAADPWLESLYIHFSYDPYQLMVAAEIAREADRIDLCKQYLSRAEQIAPNNANVLVEKGRTLLSSQKPKDALRAFEKATAQPNPHEAAYIGLAQATASTGKPKQAIELLVAAETQYPKSAELLSALGTLYLSQQKLDSALDAFKRAHSLNPRNPQANRNLGTLLLARGDKSGLAYTENYLVRQPDDSEVALFTARNLLEKQGNPQAAAALLQRSYDSLARPSNELRQLLASSYHQLSNLQASQKRLAPAIASLEQSLTIWPDNYEALANLGMINAQLGNHEKAESYLLQFTEAQPQDPNGWLNLGKVYLIAKRLPDAISAWKNGLSQARSQGTANAFAELEALLDRFDN
ncbi:tetratricopeptide repeat domain protein [Verrucomicrobiia bacterium DG1235]|nr:tetratricopeptide repeat domain protein [Verrucomicrobiae bacterium DG1235]